jgi:hypothetical protein
MRRQTLGVQLAATLMALSKPLELHATINLPLLCRPRMSYRQKVIVPKGSALPLLDASIMWATPQMAYHLQAIHAGW